MDASDWDDDVLVEECDPDDVVDALAFLLFDAAEAGGISGDGDIGFALEASFALFDAGVGFVDPRGDESLSDGFGDSVAVAAACFVVGFVIAVVIVARCELNVVAF